MLSTRNHFIAHTGAVVWLLVSAIGCAFPDSSSRVIKECILPTDQTGTLSGRWKATAVPIAVHQGDFSSSELKIITEAADTWNTFYGKSIGMAAIDYGGNKGNPRTSTATKPASVCYSGIIAGDRFTGNVVLYKQTRWPHTNIPDAMALTHFCSVPAQPLPAMYMALMELNYQNFFVAGKRQPDLKTILIHEFGHMMGLNHSCEKSSSRTGMPNCTDGRIDSAYTSAVMFPVFTFSSSGYGEQKHSLNNNDQGRANCLYIDGVSKN